MDINLDLVEKYLNRKSSDMNDNSHYETVICLYDFFCLNNIHICQKIKEKFNLTNKFHLIHNYNSITISEINENFHYIINNENNENNETNETKYVLLEYNKRDHVDFDIFLINLPNPKLFIFHILDSYSFLLNSLLNLEQINICFFNLSIKNILFGKNYKPILQNFDTSLLIDKCCDMSYFLKIIDKISDYAYKPIEIHVIFYLIKNDENTLSFSMVDTICNNFIQNSEILNLFSQKYKENYYRTSMDCLKKYINKPKNEIITKILLYSNTWDNYELSILFLHMVGNITITFSLKDTFINKLINILSKNLSPDPSKRDTLKNSLESFNKLFYEFTNWDYINLIPKEKMSKLHENLFT